MRKDDLLKKDIALLLDFDGTLVDLAPDPMGIEVDPDVPRIMDKIMTETGTPLAIVTGRQIGVLDGFLDLPKIPVSGNHGTEVRLPGSSQVIRHVPLIDEVSRGALKDFCKDFYCVLEDKGETAVIITSNEAAFHAVRNELQKLLSERFQDYTIWPIGLSLEIHHRGFNKVTGMQELLSTEAFRGHIPVYIGDDVETYPGLETLAAQGVKMFHVGEGDHGGFSSPQEVKNFLLEFLGQDKEQRDTFADLLARAAMVRM